MARARFANFAKTLATLCADISRIMKYEIRRSDCNFCRPIISYLIKQGRLFDMQMRIANNKGIGTTKKQAKPITHDQETVLWQYFLNKEIF